MTKAVRTAMFKHMRNISMRKKLVKREAIDISGCEREGDYYILTKFVDGKDYCDAETEMWVWSIGRRYSDGVILASLSSNLYQNDKFECLFLR